MQQPNRERACTIVYMDSVPSSFGNETGKWYQQPTHLSRYDSLGDRSASAQPTLGERKCKASDRDNPTVGK